MLFNGYIVNPDPYLVPSYRLSPFCNADIEINAQLPESDLSIQLLKNKHKGKQVYLTSNGRSALHLALKDLALKEESLVTILTTTQNLYISSCVTGEIERFCRWNRQITEQTTAILVNHEFGYPSEQLQELSQYGVPIIEDCAYAFSSQNLSGTVASIGDYVIYSLPKFFPVQIGGILVSGQPLKVDEEITEAEKSYLRNAISYYMAETWKFSQLRRSNYLYLKEEFEKMQLTARFDVLQDSEVPGVFMFNLPSHIDPSALKTFFYKNGIECSVFYGEHAFFIPCHHGLKKADMDYFVLVMRFYLTKI